MGLDEIRRAALAARDGLEAGLRQKKSDALWKRLVELPAFQTASLALFYLSFGSEVDTGLMRRITLELGMQVACPRSRPGERSMVFHRLESDEELSPGPYGILQPAADAPLADLKQACVVLVPGLVFDRGGARLGYGAGYYDRWLAGPGRGIASVGLAFHEQLVDSLALQPHDVPLDYLVTDVETVDCAVARNA